MIAKSRPAVHISGMLSNPPTDTIAIGQRIIELRETLGETQAQFARRLDVTPQKLLNWEKGENRPLIDAAWVICRATGCTSDWIYTGDERGMPFDLMTRIIARREALAEKQAG